MNVTLIAAAIAGALGFGAAWQAQSWRFDAAEKARIEAELEVASMRAVQSDTASASHEKDKAEVQIQFRTIIKEVDRVVEKAVYRNVCLDSDGLRILTDAIGNPAAPSEPAPVVPPADIPR